VTAAVREHCAFLLAAVMDENYGQQKRDPSLLSIPLEWVTGGASKPAAVPRKSCFDSRLGPSSNHGSLGKLNKSKDDVNWSFGTQLVHGIAADAERTFSKSAGSVRHVHKSDHHAIGISRFGLPFV